MEFTRHALKLKWNYTPRLEFMNGIHTPRLEFMSGIHTPRLEFMNGIHTPCFENGVRPPALRNELFTRSIFAYLFEIYLPFLSSFSTYALTKLSIYHITSP